MCLFVWNYSMVLANTVAWQTAKNRNSISLQFVDFIHLTTVAKAFFPLTKLTSESQEQSNIIRCSQMNSYARDSIIFMSPETGFASIRTMLDNSVLPDRCEITWTLDTMKTLTHTHTHPMLGEAETDWATTRHPTSTTNNNLHSPEWTWL